MKKNKIVSVQVKVMREGISRSRRFLVSKFGGVANARRKAEQHRHYLKDVATMEQFIKAIRPVGRPLKSEYFGRRIIKN